MHATLKYVSIGLNCCLILSAFYGLSRYGIPQQVDAFVMFFFMLAAPCLNLTYIFLRRKPQNLPLLPYGSLQEAPSTPERERSKYYYIFKNNEQTGPYSGSQIRSMAASSQIAPSDLLWREGMTNWKSFDQEFSDLAQKLLIPNKTLGMRWYKWYTYGNLPLSVVYNLTPIPFIESQYIVINILLSVFAVCAIFGLHQRREWAWRLNWLIIFGVYIKGAIVIGTGRSLSDYVKPPSSEEIILRVIIWLVIGGLIWLWPNIIYWRRRKHLFLDK